MRRCYCGVVGAAEDASSRTAAGKRRRVRCSRCWLRALRDRLPRYDLNRCVLRRLEASVRQISHDQASSHLGIQHRQRHNILLRLHHRLHHAIDGMAAFDAAGHLRNHEGGERQLRMMIGVLRQRPRHLLRRRDAEIDEEVPVNAVGIVDVQQESAKNRRSCETAD